ncbi:hypothetical protein HMPREF0185_00276 [Brevundimonas diminuta 470-4]|nr:hypothetical protein HMPREF0185_00276 [Brevundimonas diminuta 470-4]
MPSPDDAPHKGIAGSNDIVLYHLNAQPWQAHSRIFQSVRNAHHVEPRRIFRPKTLGPDVPLG